MRQRINECPVTAAVIRLFVEHSLTEILANSSTLNAAQGNRCVTLISLRAISGLRIGKCSGRDSADFARIPARIVVRLGRNTCQPRLPAGNPCVT